MAKKKVGDLFIDVSANVARIQKDLNTINARVKSSSAKWTKWMKSAQAAVAGFITVQAIRSVISYSKGLVDQADAAAKTARSYGLLTSELTEYQYAAKISGASNADLSTGLRTLAKNLSEFSEGRGEAKNAFEAMGISARNANGGVKSLSEILPEVADRLKNTESATERVGNAQLLMGRSASKLIPLLLKGSDGIKRLREEARAAGASVDDDFASSAEDLNDSLTRMGATVSGAARELVAEFVPAVRTVIEEFIEVERKGGLVVASIEAIRKAARVGLFGEDQLPTFQDELTKLGDAVNTAREAMDLATKKAAHLQAAYDRVTARIREQAKQGHVNNNLIRLKANLYRDLKPRLEEQTKAAKAHSEALKAQNDKIREGVRLAKEAAAQKAEAARLQLMKEQRDRAKIEAEGEDKANDAFGTEQEKIAAKKEEDEKAKRAALLEELNDFGKSKTELLREQLERDLYLVAGNEEAELALRKRFEKEKADLLKDTQKKKEGFTFGHFKALTTMTELFAKKGTKTQRVASATNAVISAYEAANKTMASLPFPANMIMAGVTLAAGIRNAKSIMSADSASSASPAAPAAPAAPEAAPAAPDQRIMNVSANFFGYNAEQQYEVFRKKMLADFANNRDTQLQFT